MHRSGHPSAPSWLQDETLEFDEVLKRALERRGLTLARAQARVSELGAAISVSTLSHWQSGRSLPGRRVSTGVLRALDEVLDLPTGALEGCLQRTVERRRAAPAPQVQVTDLLHRGAQVQAVFDEAGLPFIDGFTRLSVIQRLELRSTGARKRMSTTLTLRAEHDGVQSFVNFQDDPPPPHDRPLFEANYGCTLHRLIHDQDRHVSVAEFRLPQPMAKGSLTTVSLFENYPEDGEKEYGASRVHRTAFRDCVMEVAFHPDKLPSRVEHFYEPAAGGRVADSKILTTATTYGQRPLLGTVAQSYFTGRGPGLSGLRWHWPEDD